MRRSPRRLAASAARRVAPRLAPALARAVSGRTGTGSSAGVGRVLASSLFDEEWYGLQYPDLPRGRDSMVRHYLARGRVAGASPHPLFWPEYVDARRAPDASAQDPLVRYLTTSSARLRSTHPLFDAESYVREHPAAVHHPFGPLGHFLESATPGSLLPAPGLAPGSRAQVTWGEARAVLVEALRGYAEQERLRKAPRRTATFDGRAGSGLVSEHAGHAPSRRTGEPLVSIVLPVYNRAGLVQAAVASVRAQTLEDWELLLVDDGSTDDTPAVLAAAAAADRRIRVVHAEHEGVSAARNHGLAAARGRYVAWLDSDNTWTPYFLRTMTGEMAARGHRAAYAVLEMHASGGTTYRAMAGDHRHLEVSNYIDLNVLVVERSVLDEVGGFDTDLRRAVDYDLVLRISAAHPLALVPVVGAVYNARDEHLDRITVSEGTAWGEVVKNRRLIDWAALTAAPRVAGRLSVLVPVGSDWRQVERCVEVLLGGSPDGGPAPGDVQVVLAGNESKLPATLCYASLGLRDRRVVFLRSPVDVRRALATNLAAASSDGELLLLLDGPAQLIGQGLPALRRELENPACRAAGLVALDSWGAVHDAGYELPPGAGVPAPLLHGLAADDAAGSREVPALGGSALGVRAGDFIAAQGLDPIYTNGLEGPDLSLRLLSGHPGQLRIAAEGAVVVPPAARAQRPHFGDRSRSTWRERWGDLAVTGDDAGGAYAALGLRVAHYQPGREPRMPLSPVLVRAPWGSPEAERPLRWSVKIAQPLRSREPWGDLFFAHSLARALRDLGQHVVVDTREAAVRPTSYLDDVVLVLRGLVPVQPQPGRTVLLWVISHPEDVTGAELREADAAFAASASWAEWAEAGYGVRVEPLLQCTDPARFAPPADGDAAPGPQENGVLFVGNSRNVLRPVVRDALAVGADLTVHGTRWEQYIDPAHIASQHVGNHELGRLYSGAGVVLNDHWDDMRHHGFLSNRLFDATAAGARVVTDEIEGVEIFGGSVRCYSDLEELRTLLTRPYGSSFPDDATRRASAERIRREHSFAARAATLLGRVRELRGEKPGER